MAKHRSETPFEWRKGSYDYDGSMREVPDARPPKPKRHYFRWLFLVVQLLFVLWIVVGTHKGAQTACNGLSSVDCRNAHDVGNTVAVGLIIGLWAAVDIILGIGYAVMKLAGRK